jgi:hypothetical protein
MALHCTLGDNGKLIETTTVFFPTFGECALDARHRGYTATQKVV